LSISDYIHRLLSFEEYSFSLEEVISATGKNKSSIKSQLSRLIEKGEIVNLRKGFYLILPPRYSISGKLPAELYLEKLFKFLHREYYMGFYSAAKIHGAGHQQIQKDYIMIQHPKLLDISKPSFGLRFFTMVNWPKNNILVKKSDAGNFNISSRVLTLVDLVHYQSKLGGLNRMLAIIEELSEEIDSDDLSNLLSWYPYISTLQRVGYLLEVLCAKRELVDQLFAHVEMTKYFPVLLSVSSQKRPGSVSNKWKVDVNIILENDL
jgi:predicted transcriptional regulator of viral defense system